MALLHFTRQTRGSVFHDYSYDGLYLKFCFSGLYKSSPLFCKSVIMNMLLNDEQFQRDDEGGYEVVPIPNRC